MLSGVAAAETTMADHFLRGGWRTHAIGKWHAVRASPSPSSSGPAAGQLPAVDRRRLSLFAQGFYKDEFTPTFRGFNSFYGFYTGGEDYFTHNAGGYDFHRDPSPRCHQANCSQVAWEDKGKYSTIAFASEAVDVINAHPVAEAPLFLYLAFQAVHAPPEVPKYYVPIYGSCVYALFRLQTESCGMPSVDRTVGAATVSLSALGAGAQAHPRPEACELRGHARRHVRA